jgi:hypothetical protein
VLRRKGKSTVFATVLSLGVSPPGRGSRPSRGPLDERRGRGGDGHRGGPGRQGMAHGRCGRPHVVTTAKCRLRPTLNAALDGPVNLRTGTTDPQPSLLWECLRRAGAVAYFQAPTLAGVLRLDLPGYAPTESVQEGPL